MTAPKFPRIKSTREPIFSEKARELMREVAADPKKGAEFLKRAGIMDENGELAAPYRTPK